MSIDIRSGLTDSMVHGTVIAGSHDAVVVLCGLQGIKGADGLMSDSAVISLVDSHIYADPTADGIKYENGHISLSIETLTEA